MSTTLETTASNDIRARAAWNLRALMAGQRLNASRAADTLGLSRMYVGRRLNGQADLTYPDLVAFAELLGMKTSELAARLEGDTPNLQHQD